jgi:hypothetical protein
VILYLPLVSTFGFEKEKNNMLFGKCFYSSRKGGRRPKRVSTWLERPSFPKNITL